ERIARRHLARGLAAEVVVVLVAGGDAGGELLGEVGLQPDVRGVAVAVVGARDLRREAAEALRPGRRARHAQAGVGVGAVLARRLVPLLVARLQAERERGRVGQAPVELAADV